MGGTAIENANNKPPQVLKPIWRLFYFGAQTLRYSHLAPAHKRRAVDLLDEALNEPRSVQSAG